MGTAPRILVAGGLLLAGGVLGFALGSAHGVGGARPDSAPPDSASPDSGTRRGNPTVPTPSSGRARPPADPVRAVIDVPYTRGTSAAPEVQRVTLFEPDAVQPGVNLVVSGHAPTAQLVDLKGNVLHTWQTTFEAVWEPGTPTYPPNTSRDFFRRALLLPDGHLLAIFEGTGVVRLDRESRVVWTYAGGCHHDLWIDTDGNIHTLGRRLRADVPDALRGFPTYLEGPYMEDTAIMLSPEGEELRVLTILDAVVSSDWASSVMLLPRAGDFLHPNTLEVMDGRFADRHPMFAAGNLLLCLRNSNTVCVLDPARGTLVWALQGLWGLPHEPTVLDNGNLLVFDNVVADDASRIVEIEPRTHEIVWEFRGTPEQPFFSGVCGSAQRLPNGNTLIVETTGGRAFEVQPDGRMVWEYLNPHRTTAEDSAPPESADDAPLIANLFDCVRLDPARYVDALPALAPLIDGAPLELGPAERLLREGKQ